MTDEISKIKGGRVVQYENLPEGPKKRVDAFYQIIEIRSRKKIKEEMEKTGVDFSHYQHKKSVNAHNERTIKDRSRRWWNLTENDAIPRSCPLEGHLSKQLAEDARERTSGLTGVKVRAAIKSYSEKEVSDMVDEYVEEVIDAPYVKSLMAMMETYLAEGEAYNTGQAGDKPYRERRKDLAYALKVLSSQVDEVIKRNECFPPLALEQIEDVREMAMRKGGAQDRHIRTIDYISDIIQENLCPYDEENKSVKGVMDAIKNVKEALESEPDMEMKSVPEVKKSWWDTLKTAGAVTTTNPGTKDMFNNEAINPPRKKKKKEEDIYPIVPEEMDFFRD